MLAESELIDYKRQAEEDRELIDQLRAQESEANRNLKLILGEELLSLKRAFDKIGKQMGCIVCSKVSTESLMMRCGHTICQ